jgi:hypothetical protein
VSRVSPCAAVRVRHSPAQEQRIESLLTDLGSQLKRGGGVRERLSRLPVGLPEVDRLLGGGFPLGALSELSGAGASERAGASKSAGSASGRTSLSLALLANTTRRGELAGFVDTGDAFDPPSAARLGVNLDRVLWVRTQTPRDSLRATERLLQTEGFPLVLLDWAENLLPSSSQASHATGAKIGPATWIRLARLAAANRSALLLSSPRRLAGTNAELAVVMEPVQVQFTGTPALLEEFETRITVVRSRVPVDSTSLELLSPTPHRSSPTRAPHRTPHESAA